MCDFCKRPYDGWIIELKEKNINICANCLAYWGATLVGCTNDQKYDFPKELVGNGICEISGESGAIKMRYSNEHFGNETYTLNKDTFVRFICHDLKANEYLKLLEVGHSRYEYMIHDDFYSDNGYAYQPIRKGQW